MISVLSLYESSFKVSSSAIASSKAFREEHKSLSNILVVKLQTDFFPLYMNRMVQSGGATFHIKVTLTLGTACSYELHLFQSYWGV